MNIYLIILAELALVFFLFLKAGAGRSKVSFSLLLFVFGVFAQVSLVEFKVGPVSIRIYLALLLMLIVVSNAAAQRNVRRIASRHKSLFLAFALFYMWIPISDTLAGRVVDEGVVSYVKGYLSDYVASIMFFIAGIGLIRKKGDVVFVATGLIAIAFVSAAFATAQFLNIGIAINVYETLYPYEIQKRVLEGTYGRNHVSGLSAYSISFSYLLITFLPLAYAYALLATKKGSLRTAFCLGVFLLGAVATVLCRSRSGLLGFSLSFLVITIAAPRIFKGVKAKNYLRIGLAVILLLTVGLFIRESTNSSRIETKYDDFSRLGNMWDQKRINFAFATATEVARHPVLGIGAKEFMKKYYYTPHNTFLNSITYFGLPGLLFCVYYHLYFVGIGFRDLKNIQLDASSWVTIGAFVGLFNYTWNGLTHNDSFISGGIMGFIVMGLYFAAREVSVVHSHSAAYPKYMPAARNFSNGRVRS